MRGSTVQVNCARCGDPFAARVADRKRGWGRYCSKSCKAIKQEQRTGQYRAYLMIRDNDGQMPGFSNAHQFSNEE